jgi:hypothetical protein
MNPLYTSQLYFKFLVLLHNCTERNDHFVRTVPFSWPNHFLFDLLSVSVIVCHCPMSAPLCLQYAISGMHAIWSSICCSDICHDDLQRKECQISYLRNFRTKINLGFVWTHTAHSAKVKERAELYFYSLLGFCFLLQGGIYLSLYFTFRPYLPENGTLLVAQWWRHCATNRKVAGSIPNGVIGIFHWHNPSGRTVALGSTQPLTEMSTRNISRG